MFGDKNQDPRIYGSSSLAIKTKLLLTMEFLLAVSLNDNCPPWSIKAEKITHDKIKKDMIYKNAILKIYDVPVLYFPKFFHPDPSVKRRSGFLQPQFNNSETLGSSLYIPYFKTLGPDKDLTLNQHFLKNLQNLKKKNIFYKVNLERKEKTLLLLQILHF